jgi:type IV secretion system protein VirB8
VPPRNHAKHWSAAGEICADNQLSQNQGWFHARDDLFSSLAECLLHTGSSLRQAPRADQCSCREGGSEAVVMAAPSLEAYFAEAESWDADRAAQSRRNARIAWWVAAAGWLCAVASAMALALLMPLKQVIPYLVRVDGSTGIVDVVPVFTGPATPEEAVTRYFLTHYVGVCERFNFATAESDYEECGAFHSAQRNQAWYALWTATNLNSPLNLHKDGSTVRVQVNSVSFFTRASGLSDLAQVRYLKAARQGAGAEESFTHWVATIQYAYGEAAKDPKTRRWNPLGFKILDFRSEPELVGETVAKESAAAKESSAVREQR